MATKKPAKPIAGQNRDTSKLLLGKAVKYMSLDRGVNPFICPKCSRGLYKGIVYEQDNVMYCTRNCIPKPQQ